jgi:hypothetical protein
MTNEIVADGRNGAGLGGLHNKLESASFSLRVQCVLQKLHAAAVVEILHSPS